MADQPIERRTTGLFLARKKGVGNMDVTFTAGRPSRLAHLRAHFAADPASSSPSSTPATLTLSLVAQAGDEYDVDLYQFLRGGGVGIGRDAHAIFGDGRLSTSWIFESGDLLRARWTNPGGVRWGIEIGFAEIG